MRRGRIAGDIEIINDAFNNVEDHSEERANRDAQNNLASQLKEFIQIRRESQRFGTNISTQIPYPIELSYSGNYLVLSGSVFEGAITLIKTQANSNGLLFELIFKVCKQYPTKRQTITKERIKSIDYNKFTNINSLDLYKFSKYLSGIGLKNPLRSLFIGKVDSHSINFRIAVPVDEWKKLSQSSKENLVKYLRELASSRN